MVDRVSGAVGLMMEALDDSQVVGKVGKRRGRQDYKMGSSGCRCEGSTLQAVEANRQFMFETISTCSPTSG